MKKEPILCYIENKWAYFTTQNLKEQWGDDWNDAPYEHNAGTPYEYGIHDKNKNKEFWEIIKVAFDVDGYIEPCEEHCNSPFSVQDINRGDIAWLRPKYCSNENAKPIYAGTALSEFIKIIKESDGNIYLKIE